MTKYRTRLWLVLFFSASLYSNGQTLSNAGKEFWVAWGHNAVTASFVLYITSDSYANISITIPGSSFTPVSDLITPGQVKSYNISPVTSFMLAAEGLVNNKAIHIVSDTPIVAYAHQYASSSSGATMLMPVESYGRTYYSLNITQVTNITPSYSYFFAIASEDNTTIEITPSVATMGNRPANTPFTVNLNKGQIYNVFGYTSGGATGNDVTGSKIKSIAGGDGVCHPIGVFSGSSRITLIGNSGDVVEQQIFPAQAWGTRYLTSPTVNSASVFTNNLCVYRVAVRDPTTVVKRNGVTLTGLQNNFYYQFQSTIPEYIEANKPILVAQYMPSAGAPDNTGDGDPEMIYLSPIEQGIKSAKFNATKNQFINSNYVNVIVPTAAAASLKVDGLTFWDNIYVHPGLPGYTVKIKKFAAIPSGQSNVQHSLTCDTTFTAITYGLGSAESYGYNAGTLINNLEVITNTQNTDASTGVIANRPCPNTPFKFRFKTIYNATRIQWLFSQVSNFSSPTDVTVNVPVPDSVNTYNGLTYYSYSLPSDYQFSATGLYNVPVKIYNPSIDNCDSSVLIQVPVDVRPGPGSNFTVGYTGCRLDTALLHSTPNASGFNLVSYKWTFDDGSISNSMDTAKYLPAIGTHPVKLRVQADNGCYGDTTINIITYPNPVTNFGITPAAACIGSTISFTDTSSFGGGPVTGWYWNFGNGQTVNATTGAAQTALYTQPGDFTVVHVAKVSRCVSDTVRHVVHISAKPNVNFGFNTGCLPDSTTSFINATTVSDAQALTYLWNFGDPNATVSNPNTSTLISPTHRYSNYNTNQVKLIVTTANGCTDSIVKPYTVSGFAPPVTYTVLNENKLCSKQAVTLQSGINITQDSIYRIDIYWDTLGQPGVYQTITSPQQGAQYSHNYTAFTTPATKQVTIMWVVYSRGGCVGVKTQTITLQAMPVISFTMPSGACVNGNAVSAAFASITNGVTGTGYYSGTGVDSSGTVQPAIAGVGQTTVKYIFKTSGGCTDSAVQTIRIFPKPVAGFKSITDKCLGDSVLLRDSSSVSAGIITQWKWNFGDASGIIRNVNTDFFHGFAISNTYTVMLQVTSDSGCVSDTFRGNATIHTLPAVDFTTPGFVCMPAGKANFTNLSSISDGTTAQLKYRWDFGDNATDTVLNPTHIYGASGPYDIKLRAISVYGCVKDTVKTFDAFYDQPIAAFGVSNEFICQGEPTAFKDSSRAPNSAVTNWQWSFGDGGVSALQNPVKRYSRYGLYDVALVTKNTQGCTSDTTHKQIRVYIKPVVGAAPALTTIGVGEQVQLLSFRNDSAVNLHWTPANTLSNDTITNPIAKPLVTTTYTLTGTGDGNCSATATVKVIVLNRIVVPNAFSPNGDGINDRWMIPDLNDYFGARVQVYDRYGKQVLQTVGYANPWDGTINGKPVPIGTYYYIIELNQLGYPPITGSVTILR